MQTVMIVDDEPLVRRTLTRRLAHAGFSVVTHDTGFGLSGEVREHRPDLLLLDVNMPGLAGDAALSVLRSLGERFSALNVPVALHSGMPEPRLEALAREHEVAGYLSKPAASQHVLELVRSVLDPAANEVPSH